MQQIEMERRPEVQECIDACLNCYSICAETTTHCLRMGGEHAEAKHITLMDNCAQVCQLSADYMLKDSAFMNQMCNVCAQVCDSCADSCDKFDEAFMKRCTSACKECADTCRRMSK